MTKETQEDKSNLLFTCPKHGKESYFSIKKFEKHPRWAKQMVYVWFKDDERGDERLRQRLEAQREQSALSRWLRSIEGAHNRTDR